MPEKVDRDHVGAFSDFQRTDFIVPVKSARAASITGLEHVEDLRAGGAARNGLGEHVLEAGLAEHVELVVACRSVGADAEVDAPAFIIFATGAKPRRV